MLDTLIREISARWGLGEQGRSLVQMLVAYISNPAAGGLSGFLEKFRNAGWGGMANSWVDNQAVPESPTTAQLESVLGGSSGLLQQISNRLGLSYDKVSGVVAGVLPSLVQRMTPDGHVPATLPAEFAALANEGKALLGLGAGAATAGAAHLGAQRTAAAAATASDVSSSSGGLGKWLPWLIAALVAIFGISYCTQNKSPEATSTSSSPMPAPTPAPVAPEPAPAVTSPSNETVAPAPVVPPASSMGESGATAAVPEGAGVIDEMVNDMPVLRVFFDTGSTAVAPAFADKAQAMVAYLQSHPGVKAIISGFNDPTGDPAKNAELSKQRAQAVKAALEAAGVPPDSAVLEKPAETTDTGANNAASRRVDVMLRR
ncbi:MAG TPA: YidB family protein [Comamonas sp.]